MRFLRSICICIAVLFSTIVRADLNVLAPGEFVLALDSSEVAYKRVDPIVLDSKTREVAESVCQIKGYSRYSKHSLAPNIPDPLIWKVEEGGFIQVPVVYSQPWIFVKKPQMNGLENFRFIQDLQFITSTFTAAIGFYVTMLPEGAFQRAWDRTDPWAGYVLDANVWAAIEAAPWFLPRLRNCWNGVCRSWLNFEITEEEAKQRIARQEPVYRYETRGTLTMPHVFSEVWCENSGDIAPLN